MAQQHLVIELAVDPALDDPLDVAEVADHVAVVERAGAHLDLRHGVVAVRMLADAVVVEQPVAVAEIDTFGDEYSELVIGNWRLGLIAVISQSPVTNSPVANARQSFSRAASTARCCSPTRRLAARCSRSTSASGWPGRAANARWCRGSSRTRGCGARVRPLVSLSVDMRDVYAATHWAVRGQPPAYHTPDEDVYLPGRNIVLLGKAGVYCAAAQHRSPRPRHARTQSVSRRDAGVPRRHGARAVARPRARSADRRALLRSSKAEVIRRGVALGVPFELTLSCMNPGIGNRESGVESRIRNPESPRHCGLCSKCRERHDAFIELGVADPTEYEDQRYVRA